MSESMPNLKSKVEEVLVAYCLDGKYTTAEALSAIHAILVESMPKEKEMKSLENYTSSAEANYDTGKIIGYNRALSQVNEVLDELSRQSEKEK